MTARAERVAAHRPESGTAIPGFVRDALRGPGHALEGGPRREMEGRFGQDFSRVRVHDGGAAGTSAFVLGAAAYTVGRDVALARGVPAQGTVRGRALLAHELAHVVQQERGGPAPGLARTCRTSRMRTPPRARHPRVLGQ